MFRGFSPGLEISKLKNSQRYFLVRPDEGVDNVNNTDKDDYDLEDDAAAGDDAILRNVLLMPGFPGVCNGTRYQLLRYICRIM